MSDIVKQLRDSVRQCRALDRSQLLTAAADELEKLRLTAFEEEALNDVAQACFWAAGDDKMLAYADTLLGLVERLK